MHNGYVIEIENLSKWYKRKKVINNISLSIERGSVTGLFGENGAGKTSLMKLLTNQTKADSGKIMINGTPLVFNSKVNAELGCLIEQPSLYPYLTAHQHLILFNMLNSDRHNSIIYELMDVYGLSEFKDLRAKDYSLGMRQRLGLAIAEICGQDILILDEPFNGLDPMSVSKFRERILTLKNKGTTIILSSHLIRELEDLIDNLILISQGSLLDSITLDAFLNGKDSSLEQEILKMMENKNEEFIEI